MSHLLELHNISKSFGALTALRNLSFHIGEGEVVGLLGDNGAGIPPDILPRLFEPFFSGKPEGMGLGLSLCESIVERFDGGISAENGSSGGALFTVRLPAAGAIDEAKEAAQ